MAKKRNLERENRLGPAGYVVLAVLAIFALFPLYWLAGVSIKGPEEWLAYPPAFIPKHIDFSNFLIMVNPLAVAGGSAEAMSTARLQPGVFSLADSAVTAGIGSVVSLIAGLLAGFAVSRHNFGGSFFQMFILSVRMFPPVVIMVPLVVLYSSSVLGLLDTHIGLLLAYSVVTAPFSLLMQKAFIDGVPAQLEEAAMVDGMSRLGAHFKVTVPLIKGGIAATFLFILILNWSDFLLALTLAGNSVTTMPVQVAKYTSGFGTLYGPISALGLIATIPLIIIANMIRKYLVVGMTFGAVKR